MPEKRKDKRQETKDNIVLALLGNPNSGKTTLFNNLTGAHQYVDNWPGVTVEKKEGNCRHEGKLIRIVDLPGVYSLTAYSPDEVVARNFILNGNPDVVVNIVVASNLERHLYLGLQLLEMGAPVVMACRTIENPKDRLTTMLRPAGFGHWAAAVALISGFVAKEIVVAALGAVLVTAGWPDG